MNITNYISECIINRVPISFSKYGDGEYNCMVINQTGGANCDNDTYTIELKKNLIESLKYIVEETDNGYIGMWITATVNDYYKSLVKKEIKYANYHSIINYISEETHEETNNKVNLYKTIKYSHMKKIIICNNLLIKSKILLNLDDMIIVSYNNWFNQNNVNKILEYFKKYDNEQCIVITCCGMGAKVLIAKLHKLYPNNIYLDFGSALDQLCTKRNTRGHINNYHQYYI
jgi:predicted nucleic acid-binding protein